LEADLKTFLIRLAVGVLSIGICHGASLEFYNTGSFDTIDGISGAGQPGAAQIGWVVAVFVEDGSDGAGDADGFVWADDYDELYAFTTIFADYDAETPGVQGLYYYGGSDTSLSVGDVTYGIVFNQTSLPGESDVFWYSELVSSPYTMVLEEGDSNDFGGDGDWVFVPEPTGMALFALGLVTLVARRKLRK
jgi:hypothetical protein